MLLNGIKNNLSLGLPILSNRLLSIASNLIVMILIAKLGEAALSSSALVMSIFGVSVLLVMAFSFSLCGLIGHFNAMQKFAEIGQLMRSSALLNTLLAIPVLVLFYFLKPILIFLHQAPLVAELVGKYFYGMMPGYLVMLWASVLEQFLIGTNKARYLFYLSIISVFIMPTISYVLIFGCMGIIPAMGMFGAGLAVSVTGALTFSMLMLFFIKQGWHAHYHFFNGALFHKATLKQLCQLGWPMAMQFGSELLAYVMLSLMMGWVGFVALAAQQIILQLNSVITMIPSSFSQATSVLVGQAYGKKDMQQIHVQTNSAVIVMLAIILIVSMIYLLFPEFLANIYLTHANEQREAILSLTKTMLAILAISQCFDAVRTILAGAYRGLHETRLPMLVSTMSLWLIGLPCAYIAGFIWHDGAIGVRLGFSVGVIASSLAMIILWYGRKERDYALNMSH